MTTGEALIDNVRTPLYLPFNASIIKAHNKAGKTSTIGNRNFYIYFKKASESCREQMFSAAEALNQNG